MVGVEADNLKVEWRDLVRVRGQGTGWSGCCARESQAESGAAWAVCSDVRSAGSCREYWQGGREAGSVSHGVAWWFGGCSVSGS